MNGRRLLIYGFAALLAIWTVVPIYWLLNMSLMFKTELLSVPTHLYPHEPTISNYTRLFGATAIGPGGAELPVIGQAPIIQQGLRNSLVVAVIVTMITMIISLPVAYALGRLQFRGRTATSSTSSRLGTTSPGATSTSRRSRRSSPGSPS